MTDTTQYEAARAHHLAAISQYHAVRDGYLKGQVGIEELVRAQSAFNAADRAFEAAYEQHRHGRVAGSTSPQA